MIRGALWTHKVRDARVSTVILDVTEGWLYLPNLLEVLLSDGSRRFRARSEKPRWTLQAGCAWPKQSTELSVEVIDSLYSQVHIFSWESSIVRKLRPPQYGQIPGELLVTSPLVRVHVCYNNNNMMVIVFMACAETTGNNQQISHIWRNVLLRGWHSLFKAGLLEKPNTCFFTKNYGR